VKFLPPTVGSEDRKRVISAAELAAHRVLSRRGESTVVAFLAHLVGLFIGGVASIPLVGFVIAPTWKRLNGVCPRVASDKLRRAASLYSRPIARSALAPLNAVVAAFGSPF
jgi:hypothetical protein